MKVRERTIMENKKTYWKIKDDVDLSILEKEYGFTHWDNKKLLLPRYCRGEIEIFYDIVKNFNKGRNPKTPKTDDEFLKEMNEFRKKAKITPLHERAVYFNEVYADTDYIYDLYKDGLIEEVLEKQNE